MQVNIYPPGPVGYDVVPGERFREWMSPHAYKCLPLAAANMAGWDILCPGFIHAVWTGGDARADVMLAEGEQWAEGHFGHGTFTFKQGYAWHTEPGVQLLVIPHPNMEWRGAMCLTAIIETDVLRYPWFITMRIMEPEKPVVFNEGDPLCRVIPIRMADIVDTQIQYKPMPLEWQKEIGDISVERDKAEAGSWMQTYQKQARFTSVRTPEVSDLHR